MNIPSTMQALTIAQGELIATQLPVPQPAPGEVLIRTAYIGINRADLLQLEGSYPLPEGASPIPGLEVSGTIAALGDGVTGFTLGQPVCALLDGGGYAAYVTTPASLTLPVPEGISLQQAASLPEAAATSIMALVSEANIQPGERVLIHGGTSGIGILMGQIARALGAEVFATVGSEEKANLLQSFNILAINHRTSAVLPQLLAATKVEGVDVIIDTLGAPQLANHFKLLRPRGRLVSLAFLEGNLLEQCKISSILVKQLRWSGAMLRTRSPAEKAVLMQWVEQRVWPHLASGTIRPVIDSVFPLADAKKALSRMQERLHIGKILLEVSTEF